jgi:hypothetical protein
LLTTRHKEAEEHYYGSIIVRKSLISNANKSGLGGDHKREFGTFTPGNFASSPKEDWKGGQRESQSVIEHMDFGHLNRRVETESTGLDKSTHDAPEQQANKMRPTGHMF